MRKIYLIAGALALSSCATMTTGTTQSVLVASDPAGAQCTLSNAFGRWQVTTPAVVTVHRSAKPLQVECTAGALSGSQQVKATANKARALAGGFGAVGALLGSAIDGESGAGGEYPAAVTVAMERK